MEARIILPIIAVLFALGIVLVVMTYDSSNQNLHQRTSTDIYQDFLNSQDREKIIFDQILEEKIFGDPEINKAIIELEDEIELRKKLFEEYSNLPPEMQTEPALDDAIFRMEEHDAILQGNWLDALHAQKYMEHNFRITLERNGCDDCPIYSVSISGDGSVLYKGLLNVKDMGKKEYSIPVDDVTELIGFISEKKYRSLDSQYGPPESDNSVITTIELGNTKRITHYGDSGPEFLKQIEDKIDKTAKTEQFLN